MKLVSYEGDMDDDDEEEEEDYDAEDQGEESAEDQTVSRQSLSSFLWTSTFFLDKWNFIFNTYMWYVNRNKC